MTFLIGDHVIVNRRNFQPIPYLIVKIIKDNLKRDLYWLKSTEEIKDQPTNPVITITRDKRELTRVNSPRLAEHQFR